MHGLARAGGLVAALTLIACGGGDAPDTDASAPDAPPAETSASERSGASTLVNAFEFSASGVTPVADLPTAGELSLAGGCGSSGPLSLGVVRGTPTAENYFYFSMDSADPVGRGQTGEVPLSSVVWDNGVEAPRTMPESTLRVPNRLEGTGTLSIESHSGTGMGGRMAGVVQGTVTDPFTGESATIEVSFDFNLACAM